MTFAETTGGRDVHVMMCSFEDTSPESTQALFISYLEGIKRAVQAVGDRGGADKYVRRELMRLNIHIKNAKHMRYENG